MPQDNKAGRTHSNISSKPAPKGVNWLLVIAIDEYQHCAKLRNCVSDAKKIIKVLQEKYQFEQVIELYNEVATKTNIVAKLNELGERINKDVDNLILYFSGHGETEGEEDDDEQIGYLIPVEAASGDESQYIPHLFLRSKLNRIRTKHTFVVIDACFAGSFFYNVRSEKRTGSENLPSRWGISSSSSHEVALDGAPGDNSPFATCLLAALENNDTPLGIHGLAAAVENRMQAQRAKQTPICLPFSDPNRYSGQFYFYPKQNEVSAWAQAQREDSITIYATFLNNFPNGKYAIEAQKRLDQLNDDAFWKDVNQRGTEAAFLEYYERGLDPLRKQEAYRKMQQLDEEKSWRIAALRDSIPAYLEYLEKHPNGANAAEARKRIDALRPKEIPKAAPIYERPLPPVTPPEILEEKIVQLPPELEKPSKSLSGRLVGIGAALSFVIILMIWQPWKQANISIQQEDTAATTPIRDSIFRASTQPQMVSVEGGTFQMGGNAYDDEKPIHAVTISDFFISKYEVTFDEYDAFCAATNRQKPNDQGWGRGKRPVINVSWDDATAYCKWLSEKTGQKYRLPTEAEWEYAARGGNKSQNYLYAGSNNLEGVAWYDKNSYDKGSNSPDYGTHPVGQKKANELGLYDMSGNVWEWTQDCWNENYKGAPTDGKALLKGDCARRVVRGGSWFNVDYICRVSLRIRNLADDRYYNLGFRLAGY